MALSKKGWISAGVGAVVVLAAAGYGLVTYEGRLWDQTVSQIIAERPGGATLAYVESGRTWRTRDFRVTAEGPNGVIAAWTGHAAMGWGTRTRLKLDQEVGFGQLFNAPGDGEDITEELILDVTPTGKPRPVRWRLGSMTVVERDANLVCSLEPMELTIHLEEKGNWGKVDLKGLACTDLQKKPLLTAQKLSAKLVYPADRPLAAFEMKTGPFAMEDLEGEGFSLNLSTEPMAAKKSEKAESDPKAPVWEERLSVAIVKPKAEGENPDRVSADLRLTGMSDAFMKEMVEVSNRFASDLAAPARFFELWYEGYVNRELALVLDSMKYVKGRQTATLTGRFEATVDEKSVAHFGSFDLSIPESFIPRETIAEPMLNGEVKLISGVYQSHIDINQQGIFMNGQFVSNPGFLLLLLPAR